MARTESPARKASLEKRATRAIRASVASLGLLAPGVRRDRRVSVAKKECAESLVTKAIRARRVIAVSRVKKESPVRKVIVGTSVLVRRVRKASQEKRATKETPVSVASLGRKANMGIVDLRALREKKERRAIRATEVRSAHQEKKEIAAILEMKEYRERLAIRASVVRKVIRAILEKREK